MEAGERREDIAIDLLVEAGDVDDIFRLGPCLFQPLAEE
jgi:hypothetical protein